MVRRDDRDRKEHQRRNRGRDRDRNKDNGIVTPPVVPPAWERNPLPVVDPEPINNVVPITPAPTVMSVKSATPEIVLVSDDDLPIEIITDLIFEDIGGQELIDISRNDLINGETLSYQLIKNLALVQQEYNPNNILSLQQTSDKYFNNFPIKLSLRVDSTIVYRDPSSRSIIIELIDVPEDEEIEVQIATNGIIEEVDLI